MTETPVVLSLLYSHVNWFAFATESSLLFSFSVGTQQLEPFFPLTQAIVLLLIRSQLNNPLLDIRPRQKDDAYLDDFPFRTLAKWLASDITQNRPTITTTLTITTTTTPMTTTWTAATTLMATTVKVPSAVRRG